MIAKLKIQGGKFTGGYIRKGDEKLIIRDTIVEWPQKWQATLHPDAIIATSSRVKGSGGNVIVFEVDLRGYSKLSLKTTNGQNRLIKKDRVFKTQKNLDGDLYLIYNANGFRSAYFYSDEFLEWKNSHSIVNVLGKDPNTVKIKDRKADESSHASEIDGLSVYATGRLIVITDGKIDVSGKYDAKLKKIRYTACVREASWVILDKTRSARVERVLITQQSVFDLQLPYKEFERIKQCPKIGLEIFRNQNM